MSQRLFRSKRLFRSFLILWPLWSFALDFATADALDGWHWRNPLPGGSSFYGITFANGTFSAAGGDAIATSQNGRVWTNRYLGGLFGAATNFSMNGICWGNGLWVAVGSATYYDDYGGGSFGLILTSPDLEHWSPRLVPSKVSGLYDIVHGNDSFVAVGSGVDPASREIGGAVVTSSNGVNWSVQYPETTGTWLGKAFFADGRFIALGQLKGKILESEDGTNWTVQDSAVASLFGIAKGRGLYVVSGTAGLLISSDGRSWTNRAAPFRGFPLAFGNGLFAACGADGQIYTSSDGLNWTRRNSGVTQGFQTITYGDGQFIAAGTGVMLVSTNGVLWENLYRSATGAWLRSCAFGRDRYVAVGEKGTIVASADGLEWSLVDSSRTNVDLRKVACGEGGFVAGGYPGGLLHSTNGLVWTDLAQGANAAIQDITYGCGRFLASTSSGMILSSTNGDDWTISDPGVGSALMSILCQDGLVVAGHRAGVITSRDGIQWGRQDFEFLATNAVVSWPMDLAWGGGVFVGVGTRGIIMSSTNGLDWVLAESGTKVDLYSASYGGGMFVVCGNAGLLLTSTNGSSWVFRDKGTRAELSGLTYSDAFLGVGYGGTILQSDPLPETRLWLEISPRWTTGAPEFKVKGPQGTSFTLEVSNDLGTWTFLDPATVLLTNEVMNYIDFSATNLPRRFYRATQR